VDEIFGVWRKGWWLKLSLWREMLVSDVLFHEIGHHIHAISHREYRERETVADEWRDRLQGRYLRSEYSWLLVVALASEHRYSNHIPGQSQLNCYVAV
jgi:hypothetical protein